MTKEKAFPRTDGRYNSSQENEQGMTLRDYFAAKAMQGFLATVKVGCPDHLIAIDSYNLADAMLKAREQ
jgi:hypothetical protein